jgi:hypothetical protein
MYYPAFGSSAAIHLAEKYNCEWLQDVTSPTGSMRKPSIIEENDDSSDLRVFHQYQVLGDDDEFILSLQTLQPSSSCPNVNHLITREPLRERSYSLTTLDAYARLDITRDTLEQMWLSLLDLAFSDKDDVELGEYKLRHIMGLSSSYTNMNESLEKSRSHGDIFSSTNKNQNPPPRQQQMIQQMLVFYKVLLYLNHLLIVSVQHQFIPIRKLIYLILIMIVYNLLNKIILYLKNNIHQLIK